MFDATEIKSEEQTKEEEEKELVEVASHKRVKKGRKPLSGSSCFLFSLVETAKEHKLNPFDYLYHIFEQAPYCQTSEDWLKLLPWNMQLESPIAKGRWTTI